MKNFIRTSLLAAAIVATPLYAHETPRCDALEDGISMRAGIDTNIDFDGDDIRFHEDGKTVMLITSERELFLHDKQIELDAGGRELVDRYYVTVDQFVDDAVDLAGDAAGLGMSAAMGALAAIFKGEEGMQRFEERIEARARKIEAQADRMCERFSEIEGIEREMQERVPGFVPVMFVNHSD